MKQLTNWYPDSCKCRFTFSWDDSLSEVQAKKLQSLKERYWKAEVESREGNRMALALSESLLPEINRLEEERIDQEVYHCERVILNCGRHGEEDPEKLYQKVVKENRLKNALIASLRMEFQKEKFGSDPNDWEWHFDENRMCILEPKFYIPEERKTKLRRGLESTFRGEKFRFGGG